MKYILYNLIVLIGGIFFFANTNAEEESYPYDPENVTTDIDWNKAIQQYENDVRNQEYNAFGG